MIKLEAAGRQLLIDNGMLPDTVVGLEVKVVVQGAAKRPLPEDAPEGLTLEAAQLEPFVIITDMAAVTSIVTDKKEEPGVAPIPEEVLALFPDAKHLGDSYAN